MMSAKTFAPVLLMLFILCSCQKDFKPSDPSNPGNVDTTIASTSKIKTYTEDVTDLSGHTVVTFNVTYDANNRLQSLVSTSNPGDKFVYGYSANSALFDIYNSGMISIHTVLFPNGNGLVDSAFEIDNTNDTTTDKFIYNSSKQLTRDITYDYENGVRTVDGISNFLYDAVGNIIKETDYNGTTTNEYYADKVNNIYLGSPYGQFTKGLIKTTTFDDGSGNITTAQHTYTFDSNNRILTDSGVLDNGEMVIKTYTYY